jgi:mono/diheme cytochrome c family protein
MRRLAKRLGVFAAALACGALGALAALPVARAYWRSREANPIARGRALAEALGCFSCHGPEGTGGVPNPGASGGKVPAWDGGTAMMYVESPSEIREYIADGLPARKRADRSYREKIGKAKIQMPSYGDILSPRELDDLAAYVAAVAGLGGPPEKSLAAKGREEAREHGCFSCHGVDGAGLLPNPGSFKGYIPGWRGPDFEDLVRDERELRQWILEGGLERLTESALARRYIEGQKTKMPAFRGAIEEHDLEAIVAYIEWLREPK